MQTVEMVSAELWEDAEENREFRESIGNYATLTGLGNAFIIGAIAISGVVFADTRQTEDDARALAATMREHESDVWRQIVVYWSDDMSIVQQLDLTHREITTDAPLLEPLPS